MINFLKCDAKAIIKLVLDLSYQERNRIAHEVIEVDNNTVYRFTVADNLSGINKEEQMVEIINNINVKKPAGIAKKILEESLKNNNMEAFDDCTVMVLGVFDTYVNV